jgi:SNF2 family DNA or RNA helicase
MTGLGKTLMTIVVLFALHRRHRHDRYIIVCPSSLVGNWQAEFDKWLGKASQPHRVVVAKSGAEALSQIQAFVPLKPHKAEILILSYEMFRMHAAQHLSRAAKIGCLVLDEGHRLKKESSQTLSALQSLHAAKSRLLLTGTPIQNNLGEFYNLCDFVNPGILGDLPTFRRGMYVVT